MGDAVRLQVMYVRPFLTITIVLYAALSVQASESPVPSCRDTSPWLLAEADPVAVLPPAGSESADGTTLDVVTYNLHSGLGRRYALFRSRAVVERNLRAIARSIATSAAGGPDVVALNEVDFASRRSGWIDQARFVADELATITGNVYQVVRGETWRRDLPGFEVRFGNAALLRLPIVEAKSCLFSNLDQCGLAAGDGPPWSGGRSTFFGRLLSEPRGVIRVIAELQRHTVEVLVTHLDAFDMRARETQAAALRARLVAPGTTVLLGDMNAVPGALTHGRWMFANDRTHSILATGGLADASILFASRHRDPSLRRWATFPAEAPVWGLDWVLGSLDLAPQAVTTIGAAASDHRGLYVRYRHLVNDTEIQASHVRHHSIGEELRAYDSACTSKNG